MEVGGHSETDGTGCGRGTGSHWVLGGPGPLPEGHLLQSGVFIVFSRRSGGGKRPQTGVEWSSSWQTKAKKALEGASFSGSHSTP